MDRRAVAALPRWERAVLQRWGVAMLKSQPTVHDLHGTAGAHDATSTFSREDVLSMTAAEMGMA
jgi:hypothetical protein